MKLETKYFLAMLTAAILLVLLIVSLFYKRKVVTVDNTEQFLERIDSLNIEVEKLRTENTKLLSDIDSSNVKVEVIEKWYEKESNIILSQSTDSDIVFFSKYLSETVE